MDVWTDEWIDGWKDRQIFWLMDGLMDKQVDGWLMDGWIVGQMNGLIV